MRVGILSFQGSFLDHSKSIHELGYESLLIKQSKDLTSVDALILPGGESTAMKKINQFSNLLTDLDQLIKDGIPTLTTCAGTILLANFSSSDNVSIFIPTIGSPRSLDTSDRTFGSL